MSAIAATLNSGFANVDAAQKPTKYVQRLDETGSSIFWQMIKSCMLPLLDLRRGDHVLDLGCGTGDDVRVIARLVGESGCAIGVDKSKTMIQEAIKRSDHVELPAQFYEGDAECLNFPDESFDACRVERVLQHLENPRRALQELWRVARPEARIAVAEPDYGTLSISGADETITHKILTQRCAHFCNGKIGRELPALFAELGFSDLKVKLFPSISHCIDGDGSKGRFILCKYAAEACAAGVITEKESAQWLQQLENSERTGRYRHAITIFLVAGRKDRTN